MWVWQAFTRGHNHILMDDLSSDPTRVVPRRAAGYTRNYADKMDLVHMIPSNNSADCSTTCCLRNPGKEYLVYQPKSDFMSNIFPPVVTINLEAGDYAYEWFNPENGRIAAGEAFSAKDGQRTFIQPFQGDAVLHIYKP